MVIKTNGCTVHCQKTVFCHSCTTTIRLLLFLMNCIKVQANRTLKLGPLIMLKMYTGVLVQSHSMSEVKF